MFRRLIPVFAFALIAAACSGSGGDADTYLDDAAAITSGYETAAAAIFTDYLAALDAATAEDGDAVFASANQELFGGLADEFGSAVAAIEDLTPPGDAEDQHDAWLAAARALNDVFQSTSGQLSTLTDGLAVNEVISQLPLGDLQSAYRSSCQAVAAALTAETTSAIACEPPSDSS
ncbi:MAG: hypothetical protein ACR2OI_11610 [Acidimicrobiia bacterium]